MKKIIQGNRKISHVLPAALEIKGIPGMWVSLHDLSLCVDPASIIWSNFTSLHYLAFPTLHVDYRSLKFTYCRVTCLGKKIFYRNESVREFNNHVSRCGCHNVYVQYEWAALVVIARQRGVISVEIPDNTIIRINYVPDKENGFEKSSNLVIKNVKDCEKKNIPIEPFTRVPIREDSECNYILFTSPRGKAMVMYFPPIK